MAKVQPIDKIVTNKIVKSKKTGDTVVSKAVTTAAALLPAAVTTPVISTFLKDYNKTAEENYFQFKIDKSTGKPYKPDKFQTAAAMHLYSGDDVLVTAPTGTGKTAIAEYIITKNLKDGGTTFYTTPLKALSNEKFLEFTKLYGEENVGLVTGDKKINPEAPIIVMTTEVYRNMVVAKKFNFDKYSDAGTPDSLRTVIFDELQYLGDVDRGGIWEQSIMFMPNNVQILSLSATIGNNEEINDWIASVKNRKGVVADMTKSYPLPSQSNVKETVLINVPSENRHVPLNFDIEHAAAEIKLPQSKNKKERIRAAQEGAKISQSIYAKPSHNTYKYLTKKLYDADKLPAIYFIFSKKECRRLLNYLHEEGISLTDKHERKQIDSIIKEYKDAGIYLGGTLDEEALLNGYAIHNAGLLPSQKRLVEELFQKKLLKVVLATETLSAGINMPAKTTVISSPRKPTASPDGAPDRKRFLTANEFHQMAGRAGRRGIDKVGYCYSLSCNGEQTKFYENLIESAPNALNSNIDLDYSFITTYMSEFVDEEELENILSKSLYVYKSEDGFGELKLKELMDRYRVRRKILTEENYITPDGKLMIKGQLIKKLNGYEQIPIVNMVENHSLANLNPVQIAGIFAGLANVRYLNGSNDIEKVFEMPKNNDIDFLSAARDALKEVRKHEETSYRLNPDREILLDSTIMDFVYKWAQMNGKGYDSKDVWEYLYSDKYRSASKEEGVIFKEISMTIDLLKQLIDVASEGELYSSTESDKNYYRNLRKKIIESIDLIQRDPINPDTI